MMEAHSWSLPLLREVPLPVRLLSFLKTLVLLSSTGAIAQQAPRPEVSTHERLTTHLLLNVPLPPGVGTDGPPERVEGGRPGGFTGLFASGVMTLGEESIRTLELTRVATQAPHNALHRWRIVSYRSTTARREEGERVVRVVVATQLMNLGTEPWTAAGGSLVTEGEALKGVRVWQAEPIAPGAAGLVVLEVETTESRARNTFTLELWDRSGTRRVTFGNVSFP